MSSGSADHLYAGAIKRGRSVRTEVGDGLWGWNGSCGQARLASLVEMKVGVVNNAVFVCKLVDR